MSTLAAVLVGLVALIHLGILVVEMFLWDSPRGRAAFDLTPEFAAESKVMAANQGLYNGFLFAGLVWGLVSGREDVQLFFLGCVVVAGAYGGATVGPKIWLVQALPAVVAFLVVLAA